MSDDESILQPDYVRRCLDSNLASLHFRNQVNLLYDEAFESFKVLAEATWPSLQVTELEGQGLSPSAGLQLMVRNHEFVGEVSLMGHGLQMWLQTMWFVARSINSETLILDEPDVYMHADLQRRLIRFLRNRHPQLIIATHSIEIMGEVEPENVLVVDRGRRRARFASDLYSLEDVVNDIGGIHNLQLARLWNAKRCLFVEGDDIGILKRLEDALFPDSAETIEVLPRISVGGWCGWQRVIGSSMLLEKNVGRDFIRYCIFDRDYHSPELVSQREEEALRHNVDLHVWQRKEIENYLLCPVAIAWIIEDRSKRGRIPSVDNVAREIARITGAMRESVFDSFSQEYLSSDRKAGAKGANEFARTRMQDWESPETQIKLVSGKAVISKLSTWTQKNFGFSLSALTIAAAMSEDDVPEEARSVLTAIHDAEHFS